jgi:hypothetical protein
VYELGVFHLRYVGRIDFVVRGCHPPRAFTGLLLMSSSVGFPHRCDHNPKKKPVRAAERNIHPCAYSCRQRGWKDVAVKFRPAECRQMTRSELRDQLKMEPTDMETLLHLARNVKVGIPVPPAVYAEVTALDAEYSRSLDFLHYKRYIAPEGGFKFSLTLLGKEVAERFEALPA